MKYSVLITVDTRGRYYSEHDQMLNVYQALNEAVEKHWGKKAEILNLCDSEGTQVGKLIASAKIKFSKTSKNPLAVKNAKVVVERV